jgi:hypothetical protein
MAFLCTLMRTVNCISGVNIGNFLFRIFLLQYFYTSPPNQKLAKLKLDKVHQPFDHLVWLKLFANKKIKNLYLNFFSECWFIWSTQNLAKMTTSLRELKCSKIVSTLSLFFKILFLNISFKALGNKNLRRSQSVLNGTTVNSPYTH